MKKKFSLLFAVVLAVSLMIMPAAIVGAAEEADTVYLNGNIYTVDEAFSTASAMAIKGDRFIYVGSDAGVQDYIGPGTAVIDLNGKTVLPGLHDAHIHVSGVGSRLFPRDPDMYWWPIEDIQAQIAESIATMGYGMRPVDTENPENPRWFYGTGYFESIWDPPVFTRELLDIVSPNNPVYINRYTHGGACNTMALEMAGITDETPDPPGGKIVRDADGHATGELVEGSAKRLVTKFIPGWPSLTEEDRVNYIILGTEGLLASGLTTVHDASGAGSSTIDRRSALYEEGKIKIRINQMLSSSKAFSLGEPQVLYDNRYFLISVKKGADGALGSRGAAMIEEYSDMPGYFGELYIEEDEFALLVSNLLNIGFQTRTHTIGDLANQVTINAYEKALIMTGIAPEDARLTLEHNQILTLEDLARLVPLGIVSSMQEVHCTEDMNFAESRIGPVRVLGGYAWRTILDYGGVVAGGSDFGVSPYSPFYGMHAGVTRQDRNNQPPGGWYPAEAMTREEALRARTNAGAYVMFAEDILGSIEADKLADFVVIDRDYMTIPAEDIWRIEVLLTAVGGEVVFTAEDTAVELTTEITPGIISISVTPASLDFGVLAIGETSEVKALTVDNTGTVDVDVTASTTSAFYDQALWLDSVLVGAWDAFVATFDALGVDSRVKVPNDWTTGTETGLLIVWAEMA